MEVAYKGQDNPSSEYCINTVGLLQTKQELCLFPLYLPIVASLSTLSVKLLPKSGSHAAFWNTGNWNSSGPLRSASSAGIGTQRLTGCVYNLSSPCASEHHGQD